MRARATLPLLALGLFGCQDLSGASTPAALDERYFECMVQPVLTKSCSMFVCHGDGRRPLRVFARNRLRYGGTEDERNAPLRNAELELNFASARAMVSHKDREASLLLMKPLDQEAGGRFHVGATTFHMGDVYLDDAERDYRTLHAFVVGTRCEDDDACSAKCPSPADAGLADAAGAAP